MRRARGRAAGGMAEHGDAARRRAHEAAGDLRQRRLAGAVGAEQADELAGADAQVDAVERDGRAVGLAQPGGEEGVGHGRQDDGRACGNCADRVSSDRSAATPAPRRSAAAMPRAHRAARRMGAAVTRPAAGSPGADSGAAGTPAAARRQAQARQRRDAAQRLHRQRRARGAGAAASLGAAGAGSADRRAPTNVRLKTTTTAPSSVATPRIIGRRASSSAVAARHGPSRAAAGAIS